MKTLVLICVCLLLAVPSVAATPEGVEDSLPSCDTVPVVPFAQCVGIYAITTAEDTSVQLLNTTEVVFVETVQSAEEVLGETVPEEVFVETFGAVCDLLAGPEDCFEEG